MLNFVLYGALFIFVVLAVWYLTEILRFRREVKKKYKDIEWNLRQLHRALDLINSTDDDEIFAGLDILYALNHPARLRALPRLAELASSKDVRIARRARKVIEAIGQSANSPVQKEDMMVKIA